MQQYRPAYYASLNPLINRRITIIENQEAIIFAKLPCISRLAA